MAPDEMPVSAAILLFSEMSSKNEIKIIKKSSDAPRN